MIQQIEEKLKEEKELFPSHPEFRTWLSRSDLWNWLYCEFRIKGEPLSKSTVVDILDGKLREDLPISSYAFAQSFQNVYKDIKNYIQMQTRLEASMIYRWAKMLKGLSLDISNDELLRKNDPLVYEWELITPDHAKLSQIIEDIVGEYNRSDGTGEKLERACRLHLELNRSYAFGEDTAMISLVVLMFTILSCGYYMPELPVDDREYNRLVADYFDSSDISDFYSMLQRSIYNRLEAIVSLCHQAKEIEDWTKV